MTRMPTQVEQMKRLKLNFAKNSVQINIESKKLDYRTFGKKINQI